MSGAHSHARGAGDRHVGRVTATLALVVVYMVAEVVGGLASGSLALLADAGHMLSDAGALVLALVATRSAGRPATATHTYGYRRAEILAALANGAALIAIAGTIGYHAVLRIGAPPDVHGPLMLAVASGGLAVNLAGLYILRGGKSESLNVRGVWLHVVADALGSVGAIASGVLVWAFGWNLADPIASLIIAALVVYSGWHLLAQTTGVLMEAVPKGIELSSVERVLTSVDGVLSAHDLHVWSVAGEGAVMSAHLTVAPDADRRHVIDEIHRRIGQEFGVHHSTIQLDCPGDCAPCPGAVAPG
jgi:cobalt-zinc-cadmium efflux system protein